MTDWLIGWEAVLNHPVLIGDFYDSPMERFFDSV